MGHVHPFVLVAAKYKCPVAMNVAIELKEKIFKMHKGQSKLENSNYLQRHTSETEQDDYPTFEKIIYNSKESTLAQQSTCISPLLIPYIPFLI